MTRDIPDACVVGGGPAGRLAALALAERGFLVTLMDAGDERPADDGRTTSLAYASVRALRRLGVWDALEEEACPVTDIVVANAVARDRFRSGGVQGGVLSFNDGLLGDRDRWEGTPLAFMVENETLRGALRAACDEAEAKQRIGTVTGLVTGMKTDQGGVTLSLSRGDALRARMVVAADGPRSTLRRRSGLRAAERDTGQDALTYIVGHERPHEGVARQAFLPGGPFAALPLKADRSSVVWSLPRARAEAAMADDETLLRLTRDRLGEALGELTLETPPQRYPLRTLRAEGMAADRLVLVGEAAHVLHPIAGQGFNLSLRDACALTDVLDDARSTGLDIGYGAVLAEYDRWRRPDVTAMTLGTSVLARTLSTRGRVARGLTGLGLGLVQRSSTFRSVLAREAGGDTGRLPSLMAS